MAIEPEIFEGRRERKKRELRERIYRTARGLFRDHGVEATTVENIADAADVAPATVFNHFQSKDRLVDEITAEVFGGLQDLIDQSVLRPGPASVEERIMALADHAAEQIERSQGIAHRVLLEFLHRSARREDAVPYVARLHGPLAAVIGDGQRRGEVRGDLDARFLAEMVVGTLNATLINWMNDATYPLRERLREAARFVSESIRMDLESSRSSAHPRGRP
jgi:AcrR family transcriptional regulator